MSSREVILQAVRQHQIPATPLPAIPHFTPPAADSIAAFSTSLALMGGVADSRFMDAAPDEPALTAYLHQLFPDAVRFCSATPEVTGNVALSADSAPASLKDVDVGIVRARFGVAESGSVFLSEQELCVNTLGFLAQHLVVLLDARAILPDLHAAYRNPRFLCARYAVLVSGPSATADIEGVLILGAQGVKSLRVIFCQSSEQMPG